MSTDIVEQILDSIPDKEIAKGVYLKSVAICLKKELQRKNISQTDLAEKMGKNKSEISNYLNGGHNFTLSTIFEICWALGIEPASPFSVLNK